MSDKISIVIAAHGEGVYLPGILNSIARQRQYRSGISTKNTPYNYEAGPEFTKPNLEVIVCWDGQVPFHGAFLLSDYKVEGGHLLNTRLGAMKELGEIEMWVGNQPIKAIECKKEGGVGHHTREPGIKAATGDWIVCTNQDNFFMHGWLHSVVQCLQPQYGIVYWDIVSNLQTWKAPSAALEWGRIDLSSCCIRAEIAKEVGFPWRNYDGDWDYINACSKLCHKKGLRPIHINEILGVHN